MNLNNVTRSDQVTNFLCVVAGVRRDVLERVPGARSQSATLGLLLLLTPALSGITMGYAILRTFAGAPFGWLVATGGGLLWTGIVFGIERALLLGIDKSKGVKHLLFQVALRVPLAVAVGVAISKPLLLRVCQTVLDRELHNIERSNVKKEMDENAEIEQVSERTQEANSLERAQAAQERRVEADPNTQEYADAKTAVSNAETKHDRIVRRNGPLIARLERELTQMNSSTNPKDTESEQRAGILSQLVAQYRREISQASIERSAAQRHLQELRNEWKQKEGSKLTQLTERLVAARDQRTAATQRTGERNQKTETALGSLLQPNLVNEYTILRRIEKDSANPDAKTLSRFEWSLDLLFIVLELTPISIKALGRLSPMDHAIFAAEAEDEERALNASNLAIARIQKATEVARAVEETALEMWRDGATERLKAQGQVTTQDLQQITREAASVAATAA